MVAPIDAKSSFEVGGETITLHLNFRTLALAKKNGVNLFGGDLDPVDIAIAIRCLATPSHPKLTDDEAFAMVMKGGESAASAIAELFAEFGDAAGGEEDEGNVAKAAA